uniref:Retrovirus-related Pol polyprotein from transposon opus n=1 Tax=Cajanus cajan TaxID=3821 RepID=A0A151S0U7_CAJCA|nr:Retrovirus-related Pol polyprotein from transposon opus [Cajanus cajan]
MQTALLDHWKSLPLDKYDGTTDPDEHVDVFLTQVTLSTNDDAALCRIFPTSLKGRALSWFTRLPANSIDSFSTLASQFTIQFATSRPHQLTSLALISIQKQPIQVGILDAQLTYLGTVLSEQEKTAIGQVILDNRDLFAWHPSDMPGIDPDFLCHKLSISREARPIAQRHEEKTAFITETANYCYRVMPFGLKNAGATYQRLMNKIFQDQIGRCLEVYVDDMVVKSEDVSAHMCDLAEVFRALRQHRMRLNPEKCVFGVSGGKFLGFMLSSRGIEANPDKCQAILEMKSPSTLKEECEESFQQFKQRLSSPPVLSKPFANSDMIAYLAVSSHSVSAVLIQENQEGQQPVYFTSRTLQDAERRYQLIEKVALALVYTARRLRQYFQSHRVVVRTDCPIEKVLRKPELAGRMMVWSVELSEFDISFEPRGPIKSQHLADFVNELTPSGSFEDES